MINSSASGHWKLTSSSPTAASASALRVLYQCFHYQSILSLYHVTYVLFKCFHKFWTISTTLYVTQLHNDTVNPNLTGAEFNEKKVNEVKQAQNDAALVANEVAYNMKYLHTSSVRIYCTWISVRSKVRQNLYCNCTKLTSLRFSN